MNQAPGSLTLRHYMAFALLCAIWGSTWLAIRIVVRDIPPFRAAAARFFIAAVMLLVVALIRRARLPQSRHEWRATLILSVTMMALPYGLIFWAEQHVTSSVTAVLYSSSPLAVALMTPAMTGRAVPRTAIYSLLVAVVGIAMLFQFDLRASADTLMGGVAVLGGVVSSAWSTIYAKKETSKVHPVVSTGLQLFVGAIVLTLLSLAVEREQPTRWNLVSVLSLLFLATFGSAIAFAVYYWLLRSMDAYKLASLNLIVPFVAILEGALILREMITPMMLLAAVVVLAAVGFVLRAESDELAQLNLR